MTSLTSPGRHCECPQHTIHLLGECLPEEVDIQQYGDVRSVLLRLDQFGYAYFLHSH